MAGKSMATPGSRPRMLMIAPLFYPCQVIAAHRSGKFCKYLPEFGYDVSVITVDSRNAGWATDDSLADQIPPSIEVLKTFYPFSKGMKSLGQRLVKNHPQPKPAPMPEPATQPDAAKKSAPRLLRVPNSLEAWLSVPDKGIYWAPWALAEGRRAARRADILYATSPPNSVLVIAAILAKLTRRPLVVDLRDPWCYDSTARGRTRIHAWLDQRLERFSLAAASLIICNTQPVAKMYQAQYPQIPASRFTVIPNGYDEEDVGSVTPVPRSPTSQAFRIGYFGTVYFGRDPSPLFAAARELMENGQIPRGGIEFTYYGSQAEAVRSMAEAAGVPDAVSTHPTVPHAEALKAMASCDVLLVLGSAEADKYAVPGKVYEYLGLRKPILTLAGPGALADLMTRERFGLRVALGEAEALKSALVRLYHDVVAQSLDRYVLPDPRHLSRREMTRQLAAAMDAVRRSEDHSRGGR
jgi:glycosyltransferase involved in cell wall biosynthesis